MSPSCEKGEMHFMEQKRRVLDRQARQRIKRRLAELLQERDEVLFAYLYGSFMEEMPFHDIDVGLYISAVTEEESIDYMLDCGQQLSHALGLPVDVRVLNFAPVPFLFHAIRGELLLEKDEEVRVRVVERTVQRYLDMAPLIRRAIREAFAA